MKKLSKILIAFAAASTFAFAPIMPQTANVPTAVITAEAASKLAAPQNVKAFTHSDSITLEWEEVEGADGYVVCIYNNKTKKYDEYATVTSNFCDVTGLEQKTKYGFKLAALKKSGKKYSVQTYTKKLTATTKKLEIKTVDGKKLCYEGKNVVTGFRKVDGSTYYFDKEIGMLANDWLNYNYLYYYFDKNGKIVKNKTISIGGKRYTFDEDGVWQYDYNIVPNVKIIQRGEAADIFCGNGMLPKEDVDELTEITVSFTNNGSKDLLVEPYSYIWNLNDHNKSIYLVLQSENCDEYGCVVIKPGETMELTYTSENGAVPFVYNEANYSFRFIYDGAEWAFNIWPDGSCGSSPLTGITGLFKMYGLAPNV